MDGRKLKSPGRNEFHLPNLELATAIAAEWDAQTDSLRGIQPVTMPLMSLAATAVNQILPDPEFVQQTCMGYLRTDTSLYFTSEEDRILLKKQKTHFNPIHRFLKGALGLSSPIAISQNSLGRCPVSEEAQMKVLSLVQSLVSVCACVCACDSYVYFISLTL